MNGALTLRTQNLPDNLNDLSAFVLVGREKLTAVRAEIRAIDRLSLAQDVRDQKMEEARMLSEALLDAEVKLGEMTKQIPKATKGNQYTGKMVTDTTVANQKPKREVIRDLGFTPKQVERFETLADNQDLVEKVKAQARENDDIPTRTQVLSMAKYRKQKADKVIQSTRVSDKLLDTLKAVLDLDTSGEMLDLLADNADSTTMGTYLTVLSSVQNKLDAIRCGLLSRKETENGRK